MLIGTKLDLAEDNREVPREFGIRIAKKHKLSSFAEVSAKTGQNVNKAFECLTELTLRMPVSESREPKRKVRRGEVLIPLYKEETPYKYAKTIDTECVKPSLINTHFEINDYLSLRLENNKTNIYVGGRLFRQCKFLLLDISKEKGTELKKIDSIDEAEAKLDGRMESNHSIITPETEFWGHRSNLQAWYENNYDTRILHRNLAFPLLKKLQKEGDTLARKVFKQEIAKRLESGHPTVILYLIEEAYYKYLSNEEFDTVLENLKFLKNLIQWFRYIPESLKKRILEKLYELHCPYCGCEVEKNQVQNVLKGKGIRCRYCFTNIINDN